VKRHIQNVVGASPLKALSTLEKDASDLISSGMVTLNAKLSGIEDDNLVSRVVEIWGFFWDQILPYVEGVRCFLYFFRSGPNASAGSASVAHGPGIDVLVSGTKATPSFECQWEEHRALHVNPHIINYPSDRRPHDCDSGIQRSDHLADIFAVIWLPDNANHARQFPDGEVLVPAAPIAANASLDFTRQKSLSY
jgi:hypothetical protein